jgi:Fe-S cluster assembly iron-binding protein IscA
MVGEITVSDRAAEKIRQLLAGTSDEKGLRLAEGRVEQN